MDLRWWRSHSLMMLASLVLTFSIQAQSLRILPNLEKEKITENELADYLRRMTGQDGMTFDVIRDNKQGDESYIQFQQYYYKIPIDAARVTAQLKSGVLQKLVGKWVDEPLAIDVNAHLIESEAIEKAKGYTGFSQFRWEDPAAESSLKTWRKDNGATYFPDPKLVITKGDQQENPYKLAYVMDIGSLESTESYKVVMDAQTGDLIYKTSNIYNCTSPGQATSNNLGTYGIRTDDTGSGFRLLGCQNNTQVHTLRYNSGNSNFPFLNAIDYVDPDNVWNSPNNADQYMTDVHFGLSLSNNFFNDLGINPFNGQELLSVVNYPYATAYYAGPPAHNFVFGVGQNPHTPLICLDIVAHEYTHSVSLVLVGWSGAGESAAINESVSDIFGNIIQGTYSGQEWELGECVGNPIYQRSLSSPNTYLGADTYGGLFWPQGGIHERGGVGNFWFYLLVNGGTGTNDNDDDFSVAGIGLADAQTLLWHTLSNYLGPNVTFEEWRALSLEAAADLWGACSPQYISCMNAWHAVGVGIPYIGGAPQNLVVEAAGACLATLCWENTGYESYLVNYWPINTFDITTVPEITSTESQICITVEVHPHVQYEWEVQAQCSDFVEVSPTATFTTNDVCPAIGKIHVSEISFCSALATWTYSIAHHYLVEIAPTATMNFGTIPSIITTEPQAVITGLDPNTEYVVRVTPFCCETFDGQSQVSPPFTTLEIDCPIPNYQVSVTSCLILVNFVALPGQTYSLEFSNGSASGFYPFSGIQINATPNTQYTFRLRVRCNNGTCSSIVTTDWITVTTPPLGPCQPPTNLVGVLNGGTFPGIQFFWDGTSSASSYRMRWRTSPSGNFSQAQFLGQNFLLNSYSDYYEFCVASVCDCDGDGNGEVSDETCVIITIDDCNPPGAYSQHINCPDNVTLLWDHVVNKDRYFVEYFDPNSNAWILIEPNGTWQNFMSFNNLLPDTHYMWRVRTRCLDGTFSDYGPVQEFDTPPACQPVEQPSAVVTGDEVTISWNPGGGNDYTDVYFEVRYRLVGAPNWNPLPIVIHDPSFTRTLPCGTYEYQVRTLCGYCGNSDWSPLDTFTIQCEGCGNGLHIAKDPEAECDPCNEHSGCYVCIFDADGKLISQVESIYEIDWSVPANYPIPTDQLTNGQCIPMGFEFNGETFTATVRLYDMINGYKTLRCQTVLYFTLDCGEGGGHDGGGHDGGGGEIGGGHLAPPTGNTGQDKNAFRVYPNPASSTLLISSTSTYGATAIFYDAFGKELREVLLRPGETIQADVSNWSSGMYFIKITEESGNQSFRQSIVISR